MGRTGLCGARVGEEERAAPGLKGLVQAGDDEGWAGGRKEVTILWGQQCGGSCDPEKGQLG